MTASPAHQHPQQPMVEPLNVFTPREYQVAVLVALALSDQKISKSLCITISTVKAHLANIKSKLGLSTRGEVIRWMLVYHYEHNKNIVLFDNVL